MSPSAPSWLGAVALVLVVAGGERVARAIDLLEQEDLSLSLELEAGAGGFVTKNANFGAGRIDLQSGEVSGDAQWGEGYLKPSLSLDYDTTDAGALYGAISGVGALTVGDGDAGGFTDGGDAKASLEALYGGWRSGAWLAEALGEDALDLSAGRQDFHVGDGFLIWDGNLDTEGDGAYWLAPRTAFPGSGLVRLNTEPLGGQAFYLEGDHDQGDTQLAGLNLDYDPGFGTLGATYLRIFEVDSSFEAAEPRKGMQVVSLRLNELRWPEFEDLSLNAEYVREFGDGDNVDFAAQAFYLEPSYTFSALPWTPRLAYRFAYFSGDSDPDDDDRKDFDPLFYAYSRGWGTWIQGEITGQYLLFNSNQINHMVHLSASPTEQIGIGAIYYHFELDEKNYFGTPVGARDFADEVNLYVDWQATDNVFVSALYGVALPGDAAKEVFGDDQAYHLFQIYTVITF